MKVAIDARLVDSSGIGVYLRASLTELLGGHPDWQFVLLGDPRKLNAYAQPGRVHVVTFTATPYSIEQQVTFPRRKIADCHVLWIPHYDLPLRWRGPLVVTVHDLMHLALPDIIDSRLRSAYARFMFRCARNRASALVFISRFTGEEFVRLVGTPSCPTAVIHNGITSRQMSDASRRHARPYLLCVGNLKPHKNLGRLLQAFETVRRHADVDLLLVGQTTGFRTGDPGVAAQLSTDGVGVHHLGHVDDETLANLMAHAETLVMPSLYEGFGLPPLEAMQLGTPCAISDIAVFREVAGEAAVYFDPNDASSIARTLVSLLGDRALRASLRKRGSAHAAAFRWSSSAHELTRTLIAAARSGKRSSVRPSDPRRTSA